mmetsp:Transcript_15813/g.51895  ORF Transcript_15813/g.51895 Transcript_15813/m.51895 type:complete len:250 (-) Transcript_15813:209-958(-)
MQIKSVTAMAKAFWKFSSLSKTCSKPFLCACTTPRSVLRSPPFSFGAPRPACSRSAECNASIASRIETGSLPELHAVANSAAAPRARFGNPEFASSSLCVFVRLNVWSPSTETFGMCHSTYAKRNASAAGTTFVKQQCVCAKTSNRRSAAPLENARAAGYSASNLSVAARCVAFASVVVVDADADAKVCFTALANAFWQTASTSHETVSRNASDAPAVTGRRKFTTSNTVGAFSSAASSAFDFFKSLDF